MPPRGSAALDALLAGAMGVHGPFTCFAEFRARALAVARARAQGRPAQDEELAGLLPPYLADLHLADACARDPRHDAAWRVLVRVSGERLLECARRFDRGEAEVNGFLADMWFERRDGRNLLSTYRGLAPLCAWLALVMRRRLARQAGARRAQGALGDEPERGPDPPERLARLEFHAALSVSLRASLETLSPRDRDLIEARVFAREAGIVTARRHGVSPSYVSRRYQEVLAILRLRLKPLLDRFDVDPRSLG